MEGLQLLIGRQLGKLFKYLYDFKVTPNLY